MERQDIKVLRKHLHMSQQQFGEAFGVTGATISRIERENLPISFNMEDGIECLNDIVFKNNVDHNVIRKIISSVGFHAGIVIIITKYEVTSGSILFAKIKALLNL